MRVLRRLVSADDVEKLGEECDQDDVKCDEEAQVGDDTDDHSYDVTERLEHLQVQNCLHEGNGNQYNKHDLRVDVPSTNICLAVNTPKTELNV